MLIVSKQYTRIVSYSCVLNYYEICKAYKEKKPESLCFTNKILKRAHLAFILKTNNIKYV